MVLVVVHYFVTTAAYVVACALAGALLRRYRGVGYVCALVAGVILLVPTTCVTRIDVVPPRDGPVPWWSMCHTLSGLTVHDIARLSANEVSALTMLVALTAAMAAMYLAGRWRKG